MKVRQARKIIKYCGFDFFMHPFTISFLKHSTRHKNSSVRKAKMVSRRVSNKKINRKKYMNILMKSVKTNHIVFAGMAKGMLEVENDQ